ncbi:MAG: hypothetical protein KF866_04245 [Phycisphaeraceae bacterium]|nr:hypothetical protein [Phycisphaeraceae bacterium]MCW5753107.1 hypothetical protein [Phycisphaeraceae bacterium]
MSSRVDHVARMLDLLDASGIHPDAALADLTFVRTMRTASEPSLTDLDAEALDALALSGYQPGKTHGSIRPRADKISRLLTLTIESGPSPSSDLVDQTLAKVEQAARDESARLRIETARAARFPKLRIADLVSVAAVLLIGVSVLWPVMSSAREHARVATCQASLLGASLGFTAYAGSNRDHLPVITRGFGGGPWWDVGHPTRSNSANVFTLARERYLDLSSLACPGNPLAPTALSDFRQHDWRALDEISYSYRIMFGPSRPFWSSASENVIVLADRSPVVLRAVRGHLVDPLENSPNHGRSGQHVLRAGGDTQWLPTPVTETGDNIWLPRPIEMAIEQMSSPRRVKPISGTEVPQSLDDAFVGP